MNIRKLERWRSNAKKKEDTDKSLREQIRVFWKIEPGTFPPRYSEIIQVLENDKWLSVQYTFDER